MSRNRRRRGATFESGERSRGGRFVPIGVLGALTLAMFADVLFTSRPVVLSKRGTDLFTHGIHWAKFGFGEMKRGNLPLWNPYVFSGTPTLGSMQSALLYPPNMLHMILPLEKAINLGIALHVFLLGLFMYVWTSRRGLHPAACILAAAIPMFGGPYFMHVYAGHLPVLYALAWTPLILTAADAVLKASSLRWGLVGALAVAMQVLAGHPQSLFYTGVMVTLYVGLNLISAQRRTATVLGLIGIYAGGIAMGAVQFLPGIQAAGEGVRSGALSYKFASMFSLPPENILTLLAPRVFGDMSDVRYWGRCYLWEMSLFLSITGLVLAVYGALRGDIQVRRYSAAMALILFLLALGAHTPFFRLLYSCVPGFDRFRGISKFAFQSSLFIALLAGIGLDRLLRNRSANLRRILPVVVMAVVLAAAGLVVRHIAIGPSDQWSRLVQAVDWTGESYLPKSLYHDPDFMRRAGLLAARSFLVAAGTCALLAVMVYAAGLSRKAAYGIVVLAVLELFVFARTDRPTFDSGSARLPAMEAFLGSEPGDYRVLNLRYPNTAMSAGIRNIWGYDPFVLKRYAEFMSFTQGLDPGKATSYVKFSKISPLYGMLRCRYVFVRAEGGTGYVEMRNTVPHLLLIGDCRVLKKRGDILNAMAEESFDPELTVVLESPPRPEAASSAAGTARLIECSTDRLVIEADLDEPAILLITDSYGAGWRARALSGSEQKEYRLVPANYILRAIPLSSGKHRILVEYVPGSFAVGKWVSILSVAAFLGLILVPARRARHVSVKGDVRGA